MPNKNYKPKEDHRNYQSLKGVNKKIKPAKKYKSKLSIMKKGY